MERYHHSLLSHGTSALDPRMLSGHVIAGADGTDPYRHPPAVDRVDFGTGSNEQEFNFDYPAFDFGTFDLTLHDAIAHAPVQDTPPFLPPPEFSGGFQDLMADLDALHASMSNPGPAPLERTEIDAAPYTGNYAQQQQGPSDLEDRYFTLPANYNSVGGGQLANIGEASYAHQAPSTLATDCADQALLLSQNPQVQDYTSADLPPTTAPIPDPAQPYYGDIPAVTNAARYPYASAQDPFAHDPYNDTMVRSIRKLLSTSTGSQRDETYPPSLPEAHEHRGHHYGRVPHADPNPSPAPVLRDYFSRYYAPHGLPTPDSATFDTNQVAYNSANAHASAPSTHSDPWASMRLQASGYSDRVQTSRDTPAIVDTGLITPPSSAGIQCPSPDRVDTVTAPENIPVVGAAPRGRRRDRKKKAQSEQSLQNNTTCAESNSATSQGWVSAEAQPTPQIGSVEAMSKDFPLHHTAHEGSNQDRTELTTKTVPKAPKGKKKAPQKVKSPASKAATASTSKLPPTPKTVFRASEPADCPVCDRHFNRRADCERHIQTGNAAHVAYSKTEAFKRTCTRKKARPARARCSLCDHTFSRKDALRRHVRETHEVDPDTVDCTQTVDMDVDEEEGDEQEYEDEDMDMDFY